jgi:hypothetical protein
MIQLSDGIEQKPYRGGRGKNGGGSGIFKRWQKLLDEIDRVLAEPPRAETGFWRKSDTTNGLIMLQMSKAGF